VGDTGLELTSGPSLKRIRPDSLFSGDLRFCQVTAESGHESGPGRLTRAAARSCGGLAAIRKHATGELDGGDEEFLPERPELLP
jgi:hypothetical protein